MATGRVEPDMLNLLVVDLRLPISERGNVPKKKLKILESLPVLIVLGLLAGAVGGLGIGLFQLRALSQASSASSSSAAK